MMNRIRWNRRLITNGLAILSVALIMWVAMGRQSSPSHPQVESEILKVGVDLSPNGLTVDSLGELSGKQKKLLDLIFANREYQIVPFTSRSNAIDALRNDEIQLYATSLPYSSCAMIDRAEPTEWLYTSRFSLVHHKKDSNWQSLFVGDSPVLVTVSDQDRVAITILENLAELTYPALTIDAQEKSPTQLGVVLSKGNISYLMCHSDIARSIAEVDTTLQVSHEVGFDLRQVWLVSSDNLEFKISLDSAIVAQRDTKDWLKIINSK